MGHDRARANERAPQPSHGGKWMLSPSPQYGHIPAARIVILCLRGIRTSRIASPIT
ncbi:hypothetical protein ASPBRDRAFT_48178 [Aspergillus brasiliensis CBS 101740]|uniref:Uncharacterized protein n=1 Tax=Aspergillus brasiliensis (strain CBS 101740 / IMI 381727 / IBT 21946) TaxID=767769 RepID=A0A1L9U661_ASPBC|nr:hypothetical protein ASPBRDRAFT_48178 [Aspergillus brasiliensis CBS 101740]